MFIVPGAVLQGVLSDIPHDTAAIVAYVVLALFIAFVIYGGRRKHAEPQPPQASHDTSPEPGAGAPKSGR
jgi:hypothetical protein